MLEQRLFISIYEILPTVHLSKMARWNRVATQSPIESNLVKWNAILIVCELGKIGNH
jgi:hypothetical protein